MARVDYRGARGGNAGDDFHEPRVFTRPIGPGFLVATVLILVLVAALRLRRR